MTMSTMCVLIDLRVIQTYSTFNCLPSVGAVEVTRVTYKNEKLALFHCCDTGIPVCT